jgi:hypothetical protein
MRYDTNEPFYAPTNGAQARRLVKANADNVKHLAVLDSFPTTPIVTNSRSGNTVRLSRLSQSQSVSPCRESELSGRIVCRAPYDLGHIGL